MTATVHRTGVPEQRTPAEAGPADDRAPEAVPATAGGQVALAEAAPSGPVALADLVVPALADLPTLGEPGILDGSMALTDSVTLADVASATDPAATDTPTDSDGPLALTDSVTLADLTTLADSGTLANSVELAGAVLADSVALVAQAALADPAMLADTAATMTGDATADVLTGFAEVTVAPPVPETPPGTVVEVPFGTGAIAHAEGLAAAAGLDVLATGVWPESDGDEVPGVAGFIASSFNPIVVEVARRALDAHYGPAPAIDGGRTAVVVVSAHGDVASARAVAHAVDSDGRVGPLMFFQSVPNAVAGYVAAQWGLAGPVVAISPADDAVAEGMTVAGLLIDDGDADRALLVFVEQEGAAGDRGLAVLVERLRER